MDPQGVGVRVTLWHTPNDEDAGEKVKVLLIWPGQIPPPKLTISLRVRLISALCFCLKTVGSPLASDFA